MHAPHTTSSPEAQQQRAYYYGPIGHHHVTPLWEVLGLWRDEPL
jgi:hypothetical protein